MKNGLLVVIILAAVLVGQDAFYTVNEAEQVVITQFGDPVRTVTDSGLNFKLPFVQNVNRFEKRILKWDGDPNQIPTKDMRFIWVNTTARWRITDPLVFYRTVFNIQGGLSRLDNILDSVVRDAVSSHLLAELVRGSDYKADAGEAFEVDGKEIGADEMIGRETIIRDVLSRASSSTPAYGIELVDIQIKRINYVEQVRERVYERMINERKQVAARYRSEGEGEKANILGEMDLQLQQIRSEAHRKVLETRGNADAQAAAIYADAYNQDKELYAFLRTMESYQKTLTKNGKLVISADSDYYKYLRTRDAGF
ncbi:protease modulator HflC [Pelovirga terrestris]|uniref:Protein HflC n=1 Tax=Pelovirga terrestris TaxID=2771352 RepID=A0A8J6R5J3_9BACT|nr:protease modulator HflC [Pelovirga terrestris]MBD1400329.1 protease modulator HflC [Pelovirga terrestris]